MPPSNLPPIPPPLRYNLRELHLSHNAIDGLNNLRPLTWNRGLRILTLAPNPFLRSTATMGRHRAAILLLLPHVRAVDGRSLPARGRGGTGSGRSVARSGAGSEAGSPRRRKGRAANATADALSPAHTNASGTVTPERARTRSRDGVGGDVDTENTPPSAGAARRKQQRHRVSAQLQKHQERMQQAAAPHKRKPQKGAVWRPTGVIPHTPLPLLEQDLQFSGRRGLDTDGDDDSDDPSEPEDESEGRRNLDFEGSVDGKAGRGRRPNRPDTTIGKLAEPKRHLKREK